MMFVAAPSTFGAMTASTTPMAPSSDANAKAHACGFNRPIMRRKLWPKFWALPGLTLSQSPEVTRACSASSSSRRSSSVGMSGTLTARSSPPHATRSRVDPQLRLDDLSIRLVGCDELVVGAGPDDAAAVEDEDPVGLGDRRHALRDDDLRDIRQLLPQRLSESGVGRQVER